MFTIFIDLIPRVIGILKQFESDPIVAASNIILSKRGGVQIQVSVTTAQTKNCRVDVSRGRAVSTASSGHTISVGCVVCSRQRELEEFVCKSKLHGGFVVAQLRVDY